MFRWIDAVDVPLLVVGVSSSRVVAANPPARALFGGRLDGVEEAPLPLADVAGVEDALALGRALAAAPGREPSVQLMLHDASGEPLRFAAALSPLTDEHRLLTLGEPSSRSLRRDFLEILEQLPAPIELYDRDLNALFYNKVADEFFLYEDQNIIQHDDWWAVGFPDPAERDAAFAEWKAKTEETRLDRSLTATSEWKVLCRDGLTRMVQFRYRWIGDYFVMSWWDVTAHRQTEQQLRQLAVSDPLTGLWNRRRLIEDTQAALLQAAAGDSACSLLLLDVDWFKSINDRYGHSAGDDVLRALAERGLAALRTSDVMARMGGEEFAILLPGTDTESAMTLAERLLATIRTPIATGTGANASVLVEVTASIGGTTSHGADRDALALIERADRALYRAKAEGRNRVAFDEP
ncbi:sensor domain-containing diguanylate cyclase [Ancylobacter sp. MQZ15Z-1]|uniref:diguanylate cyclase n=1 Tax=Ancylobacter mangrovi TaxID=2972472 RepID=A0A9X2PBX4_9HYPH|nr:sensor domain-containing diguanylate cyclase [Ancylobacter mangrovi]MCS0495869.1 sensor domain-containing diguanylate cyclase [Ancylobacter mangrovi]